MPYLNIIKTKVLSASLSPKTLIAKHLMENVLVLSKTIVVKFPRRKWQVQANINIKRQAHISPESVERKVLQLILFHSYN